MLCRKDGKESRFIMKKEEQTGKKKGLRVAVLIVVILAVVLGAVDLWWNMPVSFLKNTAPAQISRIEVRDGQTGKSFVLDRQEDIAYIVENLQQSRLRRDGISLGYVGAWFMLDFYNTKGKRIERLTINHYNTLRKDPFFYRDNNEGLCIDYLSSLEAELAGAWEE